MVVLEQEALEKQIRESTSFNLHAIDKKEVLKRCYTWDTSKRT